VIHGDIKGVRVFFFSAGATFILPKLPTKVNILIDETGHARLADFGLLSIILDPRYHLSSSSHTQGGTARWMSPERIAPQRFGFKNSCPTTASDCYSLGMVIYETISGNPPFHKDADLTVFMKVVEGERPPRGVRFTESLWGVLELCWAPQPNDRPSIEDVLWRLGVVSSLSEPLPGADEGMNDDDDDWDAETDSSGEGSLDSFATDDHTLPPPIRPLRDHYLTDQEALQTSPIPVSQETYKPAQPHVADPPAPMMMNTNAPSTGAPTQTPANPWPIGYGQVGMRPNNVLHSFG